MAGLQPWDIRPDESAKAYAAFAIYREAGVKRTLETAAATLAKTRQNLDIWSRKYGWAARARAWDEHVIALANPQAAEAQAEALARHRDHGKALQEWGRDVLPATVADAKPGDAIRAVEVGVRIERDGLGIRTEVDVTSGGEVIGKVYLFDPTIKDAKS